MYRLFAALPVPEEIHPGLIQTQTGLSGARWRPPRNFHITLRFFGDVSHADARDLDELLAEISCAPFEVSLEGMSLNDTDFEEPIIQFGRDKPKSDAGGGGAN